MPLFRFSIAAALLVVATTTASAFQEQRQGAPVGVPSPAAPAAEFSVPAPEAGKAAATEVRIPGLGKLGNLPRMDFGLELLYGAAEGKQPTPTPREDLRDDDLTIRGTVRHKF
ncbi:MAG: hypothetical protein K2Y05_00460 [Hyphomicrobiaceae bacterium]|nr:hypothetical protein [Hyphomicrobiaceae bacterium]